MKIIQSTPTSFTALEPNSGQLVLAAIASIVGIGVLYGSLISHAVHPAYAPWAGLAFLAAGIFALLNRKVTTLTLDKGTGKATLLLKSLLKTTPSVTGLDQITSVRLYSQTRFVSNGGQQGGYRNERDTSLLLVLHDGRTIDLSDKSQSVSPIAGFSSFGTLPNQEIAQSIASFLNIPLEENTPGQINQSFITPPTSQLNPSADQQTVTNDNINVTL